MLGWAVRTVLSRVLLSLSQTLEVLSAAPHTDRTSSTSGCSHISATFPKNGASRSNWPSSTDRRPMALRPLGMSSVFRRGRAQTDLMRPATLSLSRMWGISDFFPASLAIFCNTTSGPSNKQENSIRQTARVSQKYSSKVTARCALRLNFLRLCAEILSSQVAQHCQSRRASDSPSEKWRIESMSIRNRKLVDFLDKMANCS